MQVVSEISAVSPDTAARKLAFHFRHKRPAFIWGPPGVGKSDVAAQAAYETCTTKAQPFADWYVSGHRGLIDIRAVQLDPVDVRGLPMVRDGRAAWAIPDMLPRVDRDGATGYLFLDELNAAPVSVQAAFFQLVLNRCLGDYVLPPGWQIVAAGNRQSDRAAAQRMPSALANRFAHIEIAANLDAWVQWANRTGIPAELVAFMRWRPELLHKMEGSDLRAFPTPRSWVAAADYLTAPDDIRMQLIADHVGNGPAAEMEGFLRIFRNLPSIADIIANPDGVTVPNDPATQYALSGALARKADRKNIDAISRFAKRALGREFSIVLMVDAVKRDATLAETRAFVDWAAANQDVTL